MCRSSGSCWTASSGRGGATQTPPLQVGTAPDYCGFNYQTPPFVNAVPGDGDGSQEDGSHVSMDELEAMEKQFQEEVEQEKGVSRKGRQARGVQQLGLSGSVVLGSLRGCLGRQQKEEGG